MCFFVISYRYSDALGFRRKVLKVCLESKNEWQRYPVIIGDLLICYEKLIEVQIKLKKYEDALKTYDKIKLFSFNSKNVEDVAKELPEIFFQALEGYCRLQGKKFTDTTLHPGIRICDLIVQKPIPHCPDLDNLLKSGKISQDQFKKFEDNQTVILNMGILCQWKSDIFKALGDRDQSYAWIKMAGKIYNFFFRDETRPFTMQSK